MMGEEESFAGCLICVDKLLDHQDFVASDIPRRARRAFFWGRVVE